MFSSLVFYRSHKHLSTTSRFKSSTVIALVLGLLSYFRIDGIVSLSLLLTVWCVVPMCVAYQIKC